MTSKDQRDNKGTYLEVGFFFILPMFTLGFSLIHAILWVVDKVK